MTEFRREVKASLAHGRMRVEWLLHGDDGTTQFVFNVRKGDPDRRWPSLPVFAADAIDIGFHWKTPIDYATRFDKCDICGEGGCWYDGSSLRPEEVLNQALSDPDATEEVIWAELEAWYQARVDDAAGVAD